VRALRAFGVAIVLGASGAAAGCGLLIGDSPTQYVPGDAGTDGTDASADAADEASSEGGNAPIQISATGSNTTCVLLANGRVYCWGSNGNGQVGNGDMSGANVEHAVLVDRDTTGATFDHVVQIGLGAGHACARKENRDVYCWGAGFAGQLGDSVTDHNVFVPQRVATASGYKSISIGSFVSCGIDGNDQVRCWGSNYMDGLGHPAGTDSDVLASVQGYANAAPLLVKGLGTAGTLALGGYFGCAIDSQGVACWGEDADPNNTTGSGELGDLGEAGVSSAVAVRLSIPNAAHLTAGHSFACAWPDLPDAGGPADASASCWGNNEWGEFGLGNMTSPLAPTPIPGVPAIAEMGGSWGTLFVLATDHSVWTSGYNGYGELASGVVNNESICPIDQLANCRPQMAQALDPTKSSTLKARHLAVGYHHACVIGMDDAVYCWGANDSGQLGIGVSSMVSQPAPLKVTGLP
jgi:alpha-tubulin suppressor-like RCC1 family protein